MAIAPSLDLQDVFVAVRKELQAKLIERDDEIRNALTAVAHGEHCLFFGPPGTAKSMLLDSIAEMVDGNRFSWLMTKSTQPDELFGPVKIEGLKNSTWERNTTGKLPEAVIAFLDEIFKGGSGVLNTTLKILNERRMDNGGQLIHCPLRTCLAGSNEYPNNQEGGKELGALFDRFLYRRTVKPVQGDAGLRRLIKRDNLDIVIDPSMQFTPAELTQVSAQVSQIDFGQDAEECLFEIIKSCRRNGIRPGDRRMSKAMRSLQSYAYIDGCSEVTDDHMEILSDVLWDDPEEQPKEVAKIIGEIANPTGLIINQRLLEVEQIMADLDPKELDQATSASKKLRSIKSELKNFRTDKATKAAERIAGHLNEIKEATMASLDF